MVGRSCSARAQHRPQPRNHLEAAAHNDVGQDPVVVDAELVVVGEGGAHAPVHDLRGRFRSVFAQVGEEGV